jgi:hypothetical protein
VEECLLFQEYEKYCDGLAPWAAVEDAYWARIKREEERIAEEDRKNNGSSAFKCEHRGFNGRAAWRGPASCRLCTFPRKNQNNSVTSVHWMGPSEYFADPALIRQAAERAAGGKNADGFAEERRLQCGFVRDIFNPFRPVTIDPTWLAWNDGTVVKLAQAIYDERVFDRMPILADALEEVGCQHPDILGHCRQPGEHVRGCWPVDLILGKS